MVPTYRAISGYTAKQAYENPNWQSNPSCDLAFIMYGINDSKGVDGATHESYMEYMEKLIRRLINWNIGVVVLTCAAGGQGAGSPLYQIWAQQVKNMAKIYGCVHFDAHEVQYNRLFGTVQSDNTHFNSVGYAKLGESLTSMCGAGGLLETYEPVRSEVQMWRALKAITLVIAILRIMLPLPIALRHIPMLELLESFLPGSAV